MRPIALALVVALLGAGALAAQVHHRGEGPAHEQHGGMMGSGHAMDDMGVIGLMGAQADLALLAPGRILEVRDRLGLSDEQVSALSTLQERTANAADDAHSPAHAAMQNLLQELEAETPDLERVRQRFTPHQTAMGNVQLIRLEAAVEARGLLTPEQRGMVGEMGRHGGNGVPPVRQGRMRE